MSYQVGEQAALGIIRALSDFDTTNSDALSSGTSRPGYRLLNKGTAGHYVFLRQGEFAREQLTISSLQTTWATIIEVVVRYKVESAGQSLQKLAQLVDNILGEFDQYDKLNSTSGVVWSLIEHGSEPEVVAFRGRGADYLKQDLRLVWRERSKPTLAD